MIMNEITGAAGTREWIQASQNINIFFFVGPDSECETSGSAATENMTPPDPNPDQYPPLPWRD
jgi:hypothetical protein